MRQWRFGLILVLAGVAATAQMTAAKVVENSVAATGGAARYTAVHSFSFSGHLDLGHGETAPISVWAATQPDRIRIEISFSQGRLIQIWDGTHGWQIGPGQSQAEQLQGDQAKQLQDQAMSGVALMTNPAATAALTGSGTLGGHDYYKLNFTLPDGDVFAQYFDTKTWLVFHEEYPGGVEDISDYRPVDGLTLPFRYASGPAGQPPATLLTREQVQLNPQLPDSLFTKP